MKEKVFCPNCLQMTELDTKNKCLFSDCRYDFSTPNNPLYLPPNFLLHKAFRIGKVLGHGGFGITYLAFDEYLHDKVAIKEYFPTEFASRQPSTLDIKPGVGSNREKFDYGMEKFVNEARLITRFQKHPHIVHIKSFFEENGTFYFVMNYVGGQDLASWLSMQQTLLSPKQVWTLLGPIARLLHILHHSDPPIFHRDVKPSNIYITENNRAILLDFGGAKQDFEGQSKSLTVILTPPYAPVEQYSSATILDGRIDMYALAATMYEILAMQKPPEAPSRSVDADHTQLIPLSKLNRQVSIQVDQVLSQALAVQREERFHNMLAFIQAMEQALNGEIEISSPNPTPNPTPDPVPDPTPDPTPVSKLPYFIGGVVLLMVGLLGFLYMNSKGIVHIDSNEANSKVYLNHDLIGDSPQQIELAPGDYHIVVEKNGFNAFQKKVTVNRWEKLEVVATLSPLPLLTIRANVQEGLVYLNQQKRGFAPIEMRLPPGEYEVRIEKEGYVPFFEKVNLVEGKNQELQVTLGEKTGQLTVDSNVRDSKVKVYQNGSIQEGITPFETKLPPGKYQIRVEKAGYRPYTKKVTLVAEKSYKIRANLKRKPPPRARKAQVYHAIHADELEKILKSMKFRIIRSRDHQGDPMFSFRSKSKKLSLFMYKCKNDRCRSLQLFFLPPRKANLSQINQWNRKERFIRAYIDKDGDTILDSDIYLEGGITRESIKEYIKFFDTSIKRFNSRNF